MKTLQEIQKTSIKKRTIAEEYRLARHEKRQPRCIYCELPLVIHRKICDFIEWKWYPNIFLAPEILDMAAYREGPYCATCGTKDINFINSLLQ